MGRKITFSISCSTVPDGAAPIETVSMSLNRKESKNFLRNDRATDMSIIERVFQDSLDPNI